MTLVPNTHLNVQYLCLSFRYWRSVSSDTENGSWPHWGTDYYTKTPHKNLLVPSPYGWVSQREQTPSRIKFLSHRGRKLKSLPRWLSISLRELQPPHCCCGCCCCPHPTYCPNLSGRHKMAAPLQIPPCRLVLDTNHKDLAFPLPSGLRSNVLIIVSCSLCCWARGGFLLSELNVSTWSILLLTGPFLTVQTVHLRVAVMYWASKRVRKTNTGVKKKSWNERLNTEKQHIFLSEKFKFQEYVWHLGWIKDSLERLIDLFKPLFHSIHEHSSCNWCKASMT